MTPREAVRACVRDKRGRIKSYDDLLFCATQKADMSDAYYSPRTAADYNWIDGARRAARVAAKADQRAWNTRRHRNMNLRRELVADRYTTQRTRHRAARRR